MKPLPPAGELTNPQREITPAPLDLGILLDRSSSMQRLQSTTLEAFNALLAEQKQLGPAATRLTLMLFNHRCETVVDNQPLAGIPNMSATEYQPDGGTALWDGIGNMIEAGGQRFDNVSNPPRVLIVIITDGEETSSNRYTLPHVRELITHRQKLAVGPSSSSPQMPPPWPSNWVSRSLMRATGNQTAMR